MDHTRTALQTFILLVVLCLVPNHLRAQTTTQDSNPWAARMEARERERVRDQRRLFEVLDENRDGMLSAVEMRKGGTPQHGGWIAMDTDRDGRITREEFDAVVRERRPDAR